MHPPPLVMFANEAAQLRTISVVDDMLFVVTLSDSWASCPATCVCLDFRRGMHCRRVTRLTLPSRVRIYNMKANRKIIGRKADVLQRPLRCKDTGAGADGLGSKIC